MAENRATMAAVFHSDMLVNIYSCKIEHVVEVVVNYLIQKVVKET